ncbi:hypothetical protein KHQ81_01595 [Mycoplasmatota bacterium]|nr:hypothetical protein KHQ81_01595 [Mycoplasmatota bacterium]
MLNKHPKFRLLFTLPYLFIAVIFYYQNPSSLSVKIFIIFIMLYACYISLVKSGLLKDKYAYSIDNYRFDTFMIFYGFLVTNKNGGSDYSY